MPCSGGGGGGGGVSAAGGEGGRRTRAEPQGQQQQARQRQRRQQQQQQQQQAEDEEQWAVVGEGDEGGVQLELDHVHGASPRQWHSHGHRRGRGRVQVQGRDALASALRARLGAAPRWAFEAADARLEQYITSPGLACRWLAEALRRGDVVPGRTVVVDFGCGTGVLACAAAGAGCAAVWAVDCDARALAQCVGNAAACGVAGRVHALRARVGLAPRLPGLRPPPALAADVVLTNPPFGTRGTPGADAFFLCAARETGAGVLYSLHKSSTRRFVRRLCLGELGYDSAEVVAQMRYVLPRCYDFHRDDARTLRLDLWRIALAPRQVGTARPPKEAWKARPPHPLLGVEAEAAEMWHFANDELRQDFDHHKSDVREAWHGV